MCTLAIYFRAFPKFPLVIAANRDEFLSRPSLSPGVIDAGARIFGGRDQIHGGTWLGVNAWGVAAALLNRRSEDLPDPSRRSRGLLCLDALHFSSAVAARSLIEDSSTRVYNPFNLLVADPTAAWVASNHTDRITWRDLNPGLHLLTNLDLDDPECPRIALSYRMFSEILEVGPASPTVPEFAARLRAILSTHDTALDPREAPSGNSLCLHAGEYGTRSSTLIFLDDTGCWTYLHSDLPPCRGEFRLQATKSIFGEDCR